MEGNGRDFVRLKNISAMRSSKLETKKKETRKEIEEEKRDKKWKKVLFAVRQKSIQLTTVNEQERR